jgi:hypothetical protein
MRTTEEKIQDYRILYTYYKPLIVKTANNKPADNKGRMFLYLVMTPIDLICLNSNYYETTKINKVGWSQRIR